MPRLPAKWTHPSAEPLVSNVEWHPSKEFEGMVYADYRLPDGREVHENRLADTMALHNPRFADDPDNLMGAARTIFRRDFDREDFRAARDQREPVYEEQEEHWQNGTLHSPDDGTPAVTVFNLKTGDPLRTVDYEDGECISATDYDRNTGHPLVTRHYEGEEDEHGQPYLIETERHPIPETPGPTEIHAMRRLEAAARQDAKRSAAARDEAITAVRFAGQRARPIFHDWEVQSEFFPHDMNFHLGEEPEHPTDVVAFVPIAKVAKYTAPDGSQPDPARIAPPLHEIYVGDGDDPKPEEMQAEHLVCMRKSGEMAVYAMWSFDRDDEGGEGRWEEEETLSGHTLDRLALEGGRGEVHGAENVGQFLVDRVEKGIVRAERHQERRTRAVSRAQAKLAGPESTQGAQAPTRARRR